MAFRLYDQGFTPLFRLLEDFDTYSRQQQPQQQPGVPATHGHGRHHRTPLFQPRFDVRELEDHFELHGELPGLDKENIKIEFADPQTMVISGRVERSYQAGTPPSGLVEGAEMHGAITEKGEEQKKPHKATVEEETPSSSPETSAEVVQSEKKKAAKDGAKYWVSERSIGEFSRTFSFPGHVDQMGVKASLKDGILTVMVPKAKKPASHQITIS
jgi:HSP20 family molecular chaperone IbpA